MAKKQSEKLTRYKKYNTMLGGKYKPPKKAVEEFRRPAYGMGKKKEGERDGSDRQAGCD